MSLQLSETLKQLANRWPGIRLNGPDKTSVQTEMVCEAEDLPAVCEWISKEALYTWAGLFVEERENGWELRYCFYGDHDGGQLHLIVRRPLDNPRVPSIAAPVHAADWHEREAEDMFGIHFEGHPRLGDFILHDEIWREGVCPMRHSFDVANVQHGRHENPAWRPHRVLEDPGAFAFTVGPVFSGAQESVHFLLESVGEDVARTIPRLFFKYRAVEKLAEGKPTDDVLLLAERFAATTAFAHAYAYCQAIERSTGTQVSERARQLRVFFAELERLRHHIGAIEAICESTALAVATAQAGMLEEELLRLSAVISGHRYLFGICVPGGLTRDFEMSECREVVSASEKIVARLFG
jgi:formate hydrogenlyase subunit 5